MILGFVRVQVCRYKSSLNFERIVSISGYQSLVIPIALQFLTPHLKYSSSHKFVTKL